MKQKILNLLTEKEGAFLSGEELSSMLKISRTAVWKHINGLKKDGYRIMASPRRGYCLLERPDRLNEVEIKTGLKTNVFGQRVACFSLLDSTNEEAKRLAAEGTPEGTVVVAEQQERGKGRVGRQWVSPSGVGLWFSLVLRPNLLPIQAAQLTFVSAVAVCQALRKVTGLPLTLKWPNDLLFEEKKVCGILTELSAEIEKINYLIVGIGINVNQKQEDLPPELRKTAFSLAMACGTSFRRADVLRIVLQEYEEIYFQYLQQGFDWILQLWRGFNSTLGKKILVSTGEEAYEARAEDINENGYLLVRKASGELKTLMVGDVSIRRN